MRQTNVFKTLLLLSVLGTFFMLIGGLLGGKSGVLIGLAIALGTNFFSYWFSSSIVIKSMGVKIVTEVEAPELYKMVRNLSTKAGLPMPKVGIMNTDMPNAFATGRNPDNAVVAVTTGIMRILNDDELEGVLAHELSHVYGRDILIGSMAATIASAIVIFANMAKFGAILGGGNRDNNNPLGLIAIILTAVLAPIAASIIQMTISRTREYAADANAARLTRNPQGLAAALRKISGGVQVHPMNEVNPSSAHMFIMSPFAGIKMSNLFSTHPDTQSRINALMDMEKELLSVGYSNSNLMKGSKSNPIFR